MESEIVFSRKEQFGAVCAEITLNRPDKGNALTMQMLQQLDSIVLTFRQIATSERLSFAHAGGSSVRAAISKHGALFLRSRWSAIGFYMASKYSNA
jgi:hypothetical protein